jgi:TonB family protein
MSRLRRVPVVLSIVSVLACVQAAADPTEPQPPASTPQETTTDAQTSAWGLPKLPLYQLLSHQDWYPLAAREASLEGRVLVGFDITADGHVRNISVIWSENGVFESSAVALLKSARFTLPADWASTATSRRWRLGFVYRLAPDTCQSDQFAIPVEKILITGSRLSGARGRTCADY